MANAEQSKPVSFRLPKWVLDFIDARSAECKEPKTQVIVEAIACLRDRELAALMQDGYREMAGESLNLAESNLPAATETLPEW